MTGVAERARVLVVSQPSVAHPMREVASRLTASGMDVNTIAVADFNEGLSVDPAPHVILVSNAARCDRAALSRRPGLIAVVFIASGTESVDVQAATDLGIVVAHGHSEENAESMAEATILLMLAVLYDLKRAERVLREEQPAPAAFSRMLKGRVVGLVGYGKIARGVAARLQGWGATLIASTRSPPATVGAGVEIVDLDTLMGRSDVVSLHAALNAASRGMIGRRELELLRPGSVLINTGRGGLIDEAALARVAVERELWLGLDTFEREPLPAASPLRSLPRTILTPHLVGHTIEGKDSLVRTAVANIQRIAEGLAPLYARNWDQLGGRRAKPLGQPSTRGNGDVL